MAEEHVMTCITGKSSRVAIFTSGRWGPRESGHLIRHLELTRYNLAEDELAELPAVPLVEDQSGIPA